MRLMVGPGTDAHHELEGGGYEEDDEEALLRGDLGHAFESGQIVILQPDGSAVLAPAGGQLVETENGQLILVQTLEDGTQVIHNVMTSVFFSIFTFFFLLLILICWSKLCFHLLSEKLHSN